MHSILAVHARDIVLAPRYSSFVEAHCCKITFGQDILHPRVMRKFKLLHFMMNQLPLCWLHYEEEQLDNAWVATFALLFLDAQPHSCPVCRFEGLVPAHYLACIDPTSEWFSMWMAKARPRHQLLRFMQQTGVFSVLLHCSMNNGEVARKLVSETELRPVCPAHSALARALLCKVWCFLLPFREVVMDLFHSPY